MKNYKENQKTQSLRPERRVADLSRRAVEGPAVSALSGSKRISFREENVFGFVFLLCIRARLLVVPFTNKVLGFRGCGKTLVPGGSPGL
jgi:hypothetical protein